MNLHLPPPRPSWWLIVMPGHAHSHGASVGAIQSPSLPLIKVLLQLLLTGLNVMCWLVPMKIKRFRENKDLISLANAFSGGVFLSLAFGHMIPHSQHGFEHTVREARLSGM